MKRSLRTTQRFLFLIQLVIWLCATILIVSILAVKQIKGNLTTWLDDFNTKTELTINQITQTQAINPDILSPNFTIFVIQPETEEFVFKRKLKNIDDELLWESYRSKLLYQMQQTKNGLIFYPDRKKFDFNTKQKIIRYAYIQPLDWIVAIEAPFDRRAIVFKKVISLPLITMILTIFLIATLCAWLSFRYTFSIFKKIISDAIESGMVKLNHTIASDDVLSFAPSEINDDIFYFKDIKNSTPTRIKTAPSKSQATELLKSVDSISNINNEQNFLQPPNNTTVPLKATINTKKDDDLTLNIKGIKSDILKKIIKNLREQK